MNKIEFLKSKGYSTVHDIDDEEKSYFCSKDYTEDGIYLHIQYTESLGWNWTLQIMRECFYDRDEFINFKDECSKAIDILEQDFNEMMKQEKIPQEN